MPAANAANAPADMPGQVLRTSMSGQTFKVIDSFGLS